MAFYHDRALMWSGSVVPTSIYIGLHQMNSICLAKAYHRNLMPSHITTLIIFTDTCSVPSIWKVIDLSNNLLIQSVGRPLLSSYKNLVKFNWEMIQEPVYLRALL